MKSRVVTGDSLQKLKDLPADSVDSLVTDPPAGIGRANNKYPYEKICTFCSKNYLCHTRYQVARNKTCSKKCAVASANKVKSEKPEILYIKQCSGCDNEIVKKRLSDIIRAKHCSSKCSAVTRIKDDTQRAKLAEAGLKGSKAWTPERKEHHREMMTGQNNPAWKGGVTYKRKKGNYGKVKCVRCPSEFLEMSMQNGYVAEHRLIVAKSLGRALTSKEVVHHIDHNVTNNDISNLQLFPSNKAHKIYEGQEAKKRLKGIK